MEPLSAVPRPVNRALHLVRRGGRVPASALAAPVAPGGKYFDLDQLDQLAAAVPDKSETIEVRGKPDPLWDVRGMLVALVGLLAAEWAIRKRFKLL